MSTYTHGCYSELSGALICRVTLTEEFASTWQRDHAAQTLAANGQNSRNHQIRNAHTLVVRRLKPAAYRGKR